MSTIYYTVLDSSGLAFGVNFTGMKLEYIGDWMDYGVILKQPTTDLNGKSCWGLCRF